MADFDLDSYLNRRYGNPGTDKIDALGAATESKLALLGQYREGKADASRKVREATLGGMLGLDPAGVPGTVANMMASFANRAVGIGSGLAQAPFANAALKRGAAIPAEVLQAHANLRAGQATEQDKVLLATPIADDNLGAGGIESMANPAWDTNRAALPQTTWFDRVNSVEGHAKMAADVKKAADTSFLVDHTRQKAQETQFMADAAPGIAQVRKGAQDFTNGSLGGVIGGAAGMVAGTFNAAKYLPQAAVDHPVAAGEIMANVLPDALIGGYGGIHGTLAATFPDAQNTLTSGVAAYQKAHGGNLPPKEWYSVNGAKAAAWMGVDVLSDRMMLNGGKGLEAAGESAAKVLTRMSPAESRNAFTKALFGTANLAKRPATAAGAIVEGAGGEFFAEGAQQYLEDNIAGKESSIEDIYRSAATGALGGGGISSGVGMSKLLESGPAAVKPPAAALNPVDTPEQKATFEAAIASNDPSAFLDQGSPSYNPVKAVSVLQANNDNADTAPEVKQANYQQAQTIVTDLDSQLENAKEDYQFARKSPAAKQAEVDFYKAELAKIDPADTDGKATYETMVAHYEGMLTPLTAAQARSTEADLSRMDRQLKEARTVKGRMVPQVTPAAFAQQVAAVQAPVDPQDSQAITASKAAATSLINLSMASPELLTPEVAKQLYKSTSSGLDDSQREYLRVFSEARIAQNALQDSDSVHQTILYGDKKNDQAGLVQHRERITDAITAGNQRAAERSLMILSSFAADQQAKADAITAAFESPAVRGGEQVSVVKMKTGAWEVSTEAASLDPKDRAENGAFNVHRGSSKGIKSIVEGAAAVVSAAAEMEAAYGLKFGNVLNKANKTNTSAAPVQKTNESIQVPVVPSLSPSIDNKVLEGEERVNAKVLPLSAGKTNTSTNEAAQSPKAQDAPAALTATQAQYDEAIWVSQSVEEEDYGSVSPEILALVKAFDNETPINIVAAKAAPTVLSKAASGFTKSLKQVNRAIRKAKRQNPRSLWTALKHSINEKDLNDIYGSDWKKRYTFLRGKPGRSLVDAIADGELDEFLPYKLRFGLGNQTEYSEAGANQEQEAEEYIKEKLRNRDYLTEDTLNLLDQLDVTVQELTEALTLQEIEDAIQSTQAEISAEERPSIVETPATASKSTAGSVEPDVETEAASSVTPAEESAPPAEEVAGYPGLEALQEKSPEGTAYTARQLLADFFTQAKEREGDASVRPLVAVKDFISSLRDKAQAIKVSDFLQEKDRDLDDVQKDMVRLLETKVKDWSPILQRNLVKGYWDNTSKTAKDNDEFKFHDLMQFLVQGTNATGLDLEENVKTAIVYAAMKVIADTGNDVEFNTPDDINKMLGREKGSEVSEDEGALLARAGLRENIWRNNAGKAAVAALGFKPTQDAGMDLLPRLESAFGAYIEKLLMDQHMLVRTRLTVDEMNQLFPPAELAEGQAPAKVAPWQMLKLARDDNGNLTEQAAEILEASFGTRSILDKLFSVQSRLDYPSLAPAPFKQSSTAGASEGVPANIAKALDEKQSEENFIRDDYWNVVDVLSEAGFESAILEIAGHVDTETAVVHAGQLLSVEAKNAGIVRELRQAKEFVKDTLLLVSGSLAEVPMFFKYSVWKQQRVGLANTGFNPQASKLQRAMYYKKDWKQTIQLDNEAGLNNFRLRVSEAMGVKTDGETNATTLAGFEALFDPEAKDSSSKAQDAASKEKATQRMAAIRVLQKITYAGTKPTADEVKTLVKGVKVGGEKSATMVVFLDMAHYLQAKESKAASFTHHMQAEVDGKTNGIILSQLLFGGARSVADMQERMRRGGFFFEGDEHTQFNLWKAATKNLDQYEALTRRIVQVAQTMVAGNPEVFAALEAFIKPLEVAGKIAKAGRDLTKNPLTTLMFGAKLHSATDKIGDKVIAEIYQTMVDVKTGKSPLTIKEVLDHLNTLLYAGNGEPMDEHMTVDQALMVQLTHQQIKAIKKAFHQTLGKAAKQAISETFSNYLLNREVMDEAAKLIFELSDAAIQAVRADYIQELVTAGTLDTRKGKVIRALTRKEEQAFQQRIAKLLPLVHTSGSKRDGNIAHGVTLASTVSVLSTDEVFQGTAAFGTPFVDTIGSRDKNGKSREAYKTTLNSSERVQKAPRTGPASKFVHSLDSSTSHDAQMGRQTQNNHDALISGLEGFTDTAVGLNQALWNNLTEYSPLQEVLNTLTGLIRNITEMAVDSDKQVLSAGAKANLANVLNALGTTYGKAPDVALNAVLTNLANTTYRADKLKLEVLAKAISVDQYTLEGGNFVPTEKDIQKVNHSLAALSPEIPLDVTEAVDSLTAMLKDKLVLPKPRTPKAGRETLWGPIGNPTTPSDPYLLKVFDKHKTLTAEQLVKVLRNRFPTNTVNREILDRLAPLLDKGLTVKYIEPGAKESDVLAMPEQASRGWYIATEDGQQVIYVLSSEFQNSGVTAELLLHEALHAALAQTLRNPSAAAELLIAELDTLRGKALGVINSDPSLAQFLPAVRSVDELISWGLTNKEFQVKVLSQVRMQSMTKKNILVQGMEAFINLITGLLFRNPSSKQQHGVSVLVNNVAGLLAEASPVSAPVAVNQSMAAPSAGVTTADLYEALENPTQPLSNAFDEHLRSLLDGMVSKLHGPFGSFKQAIMTAQLLGPLERMAKAQSEGKAPLAVSALVSGIRFSDQEAFVMEQVQATVKATLEGNDGQTAITYGELSKLFMEAKKRIVPADFATGDPAQDQAIHDFLFNHTDVGKGSRSDYLARFAAVGLAHEGFNKLLQVETSRAAPVLKGEKTIAAFLKRAFDSLLDWFNGRMSNTQPGQKGGEKLTALVEQLVQIELRRQARAADTSFDIVDAFDEKSKALADGVAAKLGEIGKSAFFQQSRSKVLKASGSLVSMVAEDRVKWLVEGMNKLRDEYMDKEQGVIAAVFKDVVGYAAQQQVLLRMAVKNQGERKDIITNTTKLVRESFVNQGKDLTDQAKSALTAVLLRTGAHTLLSPTFDTAQLQELLNNVNKLTAAIQAQEAMLSVFPARFQNYFLRQSKDLAHYLVHSEAKGQHLMMNAGNIARMYETIHAGKLSEAETVQAEAIIDSLVSLYALKMSSTDAKADVVAMMKAEHARTDGGNGVQMALLLHKDMETQAKERLFGDSPALMVKGYTPEIYNPYTAIQVAVSEEGKLLLEQGYMAGDYVKQDPDDPREEQKRIYVLRDGGAQPLQTGILSYTGTRHKGSTLHSGKNVKMQKQVLLDKQAAIDKMFEPNPKYDPAKGRGTHMVPLLNATGKAVNYHYMMTAKTKDALLERNSRFDDVLGVQAGSVFDKATVGEQNRKAIQALKDSYLEDFKNNPQAYVQVGPTSPDAENRELYKLLPKVTQQAIIDIWGKEGLMVRSDHKDLYFGYHKLSLSSAWDKVDPNLMERALVTSVTWALENYAKHYLHMDDNQAKQYAKRGAVVVRRGENIWQAVVREIKDIYVIKAVTTTLNNIVSNLSLLHLNGVPVLDSLRYHQEAMRGASDYERDTTELFKLEQQIKVGLGMGDLAEAKQKVSRLKDAIARNPVKPLIDAGLMPTIVEDVEADVDPFSYKSQFLRKTEKYTSKLNPGVRKAARVAFMAHDTQAYKTLHHFTQLSDFVARYALYQHLTTRKKNAMVSADAIYEASESFIFYDIPMHRKLQYVEDMGLLMFTKYFMRIQRVLARRVKENPGRVLTSILTHHYIGGVPGVMDASAIAHFGNNPLSTGALGFPGALPDLGTVQAMDGMLGLLK